MKALIVLLILTVSSQSFAGGKKIFLLRSAEKLSTSESSQVISHKLASGLYGVKKIPSIVRPGFSTVEKEIITRQSGDLKVSISAGYYRQSTNKAIVSVMEKGSFFKITTSGYSSSDIVKLLNELGPDIGKRSTKLIVDGKQQLLIRLPEGFNSDLSQKVIIRKMGAALEKFFKETDGMNTVRPSIMRPQASKGVN